MIKFKEFILLLCISIFLVSCDYHTQDPDNAYNYINQSDLFKLSMNERLNFGNLDVSGANKTHSQSVTIENIGKFAMQVDLPETGSEDLTITTADNFANPLRPGMSYNFKVNYAPKTFGDKSVNIDMSEYLSLPKNNSITAGPGQGTITSADIYKATFINEINEVFDGILKIGAKYSETTSPQITADTGTEIDFGNLGENNSAVQDILLTNIGDGNAIISNIEIVSNNKIFSIVLPETFKGHFQPNKQESFQVQVDTGDLVGGAYGKLIISSNSINSPYEINLKVYGKQPNIDFGNSGGQTGAGQVGGTDDNGNELGEAEVAGSVNFDTNTIDFGLVSLNKPRLQKLSFMNNEESIFSIESISATGADLSIDETKSTCGNAVLNKGDSCDIYVKFSPQVAQVYSGIVQVNSRINNGDLFSIDFTTTGEGIEPKISVESELNFNRVDVGEQSVKNIVIKNIGKDILRISNIQFSSESSNLSESNDDAFTFDGASCVKSLKYNEECSFNVTYTPKVYGEVKKDIIIQSNDTEQTVTLIGIASGVSLSVDNEVDLGSVSQTTTYDLEIFNIGYDPITINVADFAINKNFKIKENLCSVIEAEKSCVIQTEFTPPTDGSIITDVLNITFNNTDRYNVIFTGSGAQPKLELSVANGDILDFGRVSVNSTGTQTLFVHNIGNAPLSLSNFTIDNVHGHDEYSIAENTCESAISPDGMCEITLAVVPIHGGTINDKISFTSNELTNNQYIINLTAEAIFSDYTVNASSLNFGEKYIYPEQSYNKDVSITNTGTEPITIKDAVVINDYFDITNNCSVLNASESCNINVKITPTTMGVITDTLRITSDVPTAPIKDVALQIKGLDKVFTVSPTSLAFGSVPVGTASSTKTVTVTNTGNVDLSIKDINITSPFTIASKSCSNVLAPSATCNIIVKVTPNAAGANTGALNIVTDALRESTKSVALSVTGTTSSYSISTSSLDFGTVEYGQKSAVKTVTVTNTGSLPITFSAPTISSPYSIESNTCNTLQVGGKCTIGVAVTADRVGTIPGTVLDIWSDAAVDAYKYITINKTLINYNKTTAGNESFLITKGKYKLYAEGGYSDKNFIETARPAESSNIYIMSPYSSILSVKNDTHDEIIYTFSTDTEIHVNVGNGEIGCYEHSAGGNCSTGYGVSATSGVVTITIIE